MAYTSLLLWLVLRSGSDETLKLWTIKTNECINTFADQHSDKVWALDAMSDQVLIFLGPGLRLS